MYIDLHFHHFIFMSIYLSSTFNLHKFWCSSVLARLIKFLFGYKFYWNYLSYLLLEFFFIFILASLIQTLYFLVIYFLALRFIASYFSSTVKRG